MQKYLINEADHNKIFNYKNLYIRFFGINLADLK